jgi:hypothetical protein
MPALARHIGTCLVAVALLLGGLARAADNPPVAVDDAGLAIGGYDAVAYFTDGAAMKGDPAFAHQWMDATWLFASAEHRDVFAADPEAYAPQYGGYCAFAVARGHAAKANPEVWKIVDGKLYLNLGPGVQSQWEKDIPGYVARANTNWPGALDDPGRRKTGGSGSTDR